MTLRERNLRVLEFTKIRDQLAQLCLSESGRERAQALVPSGDEKMVRLWQEQTSEAGTVMAYTGGSPMQYFPDVSGFVKIAAAGGTLSPRALLDVAEALKASRLVRAAVVTDRENTPLLTQLASHLNTHRELEETIFNSILSEDEIADRASPELYDIRRHLRLLADRMREKLNGFLRGEQAKYLQDAIITQRNGRYVLPVKAECRANVPGLIHDQSASGATLFIEPHGGGGGGQRPEAVGREGRKGNRAHPGPAFGRGRAGRRLHCQ